MAPELPPDGGAGRSIEKGAAIMFTPEEYVHAATTATEMACWRETLDVCDGPPASSGRTGSQDTLPAWRAGACDNF